MDGADTLALQPLVRDYHSTAILLMDGRVASASGEFTTDRLSAELFCPPYLYKPGTNLLATRPLINDAPACIDWGASFTIAVADTALIRAVSLVRPGATTHSYDENQRFVPLGFTGALNPPRLVVTAPASPDSAPPGYYMLFILGSADRSDVPSIARWVRVGNFGGGNPMDGVAPGTLSDFTVDAVSQNTAYLTWTATADDGVNEASGDVCEFDLRRSSSAIDTEAKWSVAARLCGEPVPGPLGTMHDYILTNLAACTSYDFAARAEDEDLNLSGLHGRVNCRTICGGGGGGGAAARIVEGEEGGALQPAGLTARRAGGAAPVSALRSSASAASAVSAGSAAALAVETDRTAEGGWRIVLRAIAEDQFDPADAGALLIETREGAASWRTRSRVRPGPTEPLVGLCALRDRGRVVIAGGHALRQVAGAFRSAAVPYVLTAASHSELGALDPGALAAGAPLPLTAGESATLTYQPDVDDAATADAWYLLLERSLLTAGSLRLQSPPESARLPQSFALHQNQPNPFRAATTIRFDLPSAGLVRLEVFDLLGRRVRALSNHWHPPGSHEVEWDRRDANGARVGPGAYFYRIEVGTMRDRKKMVLLP